ncbi:MAG TPA: ergothioneine biosynthesis protein EgtB [Polyangiaceae bacterium]|nr:ergothioneine biosynthesis protein EgtB [Polyangiaceae bacterium]
MAGREQAVTRVAADERAASLLQEYRETRALTERLCEPLATEDYVVQSMPDASPTKWHLGHTTWFFETFVLGPHEPNFRPYDEVFAYLHNSYYEGVGARQPRAERGMLTRPTVDEVYAYRASIDDRMGEFLTSEVAARKDVLDLVELGVNHEQQHQELLLTDLQHLLSLNPLRPALTGPAPTPPIAASSSEYIEHEGGLFEIGHFADGFAFDNEGPPHRVHLEPFAIAASPVTAGEFLEFVEAGGYARSELWLSDGWSMVQREGWRAPLYWENVSGAWQRFSLYGMIALDKNAPVCHLSYYEADAFARWQGARLPTEAEWEVCARELSSDGQFLDRGVLVPVPPARGSGFAGGAWTWTASPYSPYPRFTPAAGAVGEYNGKFMVNQMVLRGASCFTPAAHVRPTYRNFFPPAARWQVTGMRLARK